MLVKELIETTHENEYVDTDLYGLADALHCHTADSHWGYDYKQLQSRLYKRVIKNHSYDGRRIWYLALVIFDLIPVAIIQKAGREGDDWDRVLVIDKDKYLEACKYLDSLIEYDIPDEIDSETIVDNFYGQSLSKPFESY